MARPRLTIYNEISVDGRVGGFAQDPVRYYRRGFRWHSDAILMGSVTAQSFGPAEASVEQELVLPAPARFPVMAGFEDLVYEPRPLLIVPDGRGEVRNWIHTLAQPWYRSVVVLVSDSTPSEYLGYLRRRRIGYLVAGERRVDLAVALEQLAADHGVQSIRTDAGGALNGALLAAGLVDEIAVILNPSISGRPESQSLVQLPEALADSGLPLTLVEIERLADDALWLLYKTRE